MLFNIEMHSLFFPVVYSDSPPYGFTINLYKKETLGGGWIYSQQPPLETNSCFAHVSFSY